MENERMTHAEQAVLLWPLLAGCSHSTDSELCSGMTDLRHNPATFRSVRQS